jgi:putative flippase GtrA
LVGVLIFELPPPTAKWAGIMRALLMNFGLNMRFVFDTKEIKSAMFLDPGAWQISEVIREVVARRSI